MADIRQLQQDLQQRMMSQPAPAPSVPRPPSLADQLRQRMGARPAEDTEDQGSFQPAALPGSPATNGAPMGSMSNTAAPMGSVPSQYSQMPRRMLTHLNDTMGDAGGLILSPYQMPARMSGPTILGSANPVANIFTGQNSPYSQGAVSRGLAALGRR